jgi:hypothetical protein
MKVTEKQLDIMDEASALIRAAQRETYEITLAEALEIIKIQRLCSIDNSIGALSGVIAEKLNPTE